MTAGLGRVTSREAPPPQSEASGGSTWGTRRPPGGPPPEQGLQAPRSCGTQQAAPRNAPDAPVLGRRERSPLFRSWEDCASSVPQGPGVVRTPAQNGGPPEGRRACGPRPENRAPSARGRGNGGGKSPSHARRRQEDSADGRATQSDRAAPFSWRLFSRVGQN